MKNNTDIENTIYQGENPHQRHVIEPKKNSSEEVLGEDNDHDHMIQKTKEMLKGDISLNTGENYLFLVNFSGLEKRMVHDHVHGEPDHVHSNDQQNDMMDTGDGRKLSRKFSGIADILERKIKAGTNNCD